MSYHWKITKLEKQNYFYTFSYFIDGDIILNKKDDNDHDNDEGDCDSDNDYGDDDDDNFMVMVILVMVMMTMITVMVMATMILVMMTIGRKRHAAQCQHVHSVCLGGQLQLFTFQKLSHGDDDGDIDDDHDDDIDDGGDGDY